MVVPADRNNQQESPAYPFFPPAFADQLAGVLSYVLLQMAGGLQRAAEAMTQDRRGPTPFCTFCRSLIDTAAATVRDDRIYCGDHCYVASLAARSCMERDAPQHTEPGRTFACHYCGGRIDPAVGILRHGNFYCSEYCHLGYLADVRTRASRP